MRSSFIPAVLLPVALVIGAARPAAASQVFPETVAAAVPGLPCTPQCTLCHATLAGGIADKQFALNLKMAGAVTQRDTNSLRAALMALEAKGAASDADKDGKGDYAELAAGDDPNSADATSSLCETAPLYGCGATIARTPLARGLDPASAVIAAFVLLGGLFTLRRTRHRR